MSTAKKLALIAAGYAFAAAAALALVWIRERLMPAEISAASGGMVAFGDMILFVLAAGFLSLPPTWFLLKLSVEKTPRALLGALLLLAATGPASWLLVTRMPAAGAGTAPRAVNELLGLLVAFAAIPRIVAGPPLLCAEGVAFLLSRGRTARAALAAAMLLDFVPLTMFAAHMLRAAAR